MVMKGILRRLIHWLPVLAALLLVAAPTPVRTANAGDELAAALRAAGEGGIDRLSTLRMMVWTEAQEVIPLVLPRPSQNEEARLSEAETRAKAALASRPDLLEAMILLGRLAWIASRPDEAGEYYRRALSLSPGYGPALLGLADLSLDRREPEQAASFLGQNQSIDSGHTAEVVLRRAVLALWRGDGPGAVSALATVEPPSGEGSLPYLFFLAKGYLQSGLVREAAALLARQVPSWGGGLWAEEYGLVLHGLGDGERAAAELDRAAALLPGHPLPRWERAVFALEKRDAAGAAAVMTEEPAGLGRLTTAGLFLYGLAKEEAKDYPAAVKAYTRLVELRPRFGLGYYHLARALYSSQRYEDALRSLGQGLAVAPGLPCLHLQRAEIYERLKMKKQAAGEREKAASLGMAAEVGGWHLRLAAAEGVGLIGLAGAGAPPQGIFFSQDGRRWLWRPWHGSAVALQAAAGRNLYVIPDLAVGEGPLLSGQVPSPAPLDFRPPAFLQSCLVKRAEDGTSLSWRTDEPTRAELWIRPRDGSSGGLRIAVPEYTLWHRISLAELLPGDYFFNVTITDVAGNTNTSDPAPLTIEPMPSVLAGGVSVEGGASFVKDRRVNLLLSLEGSTAGAFVRIANEDGWFTEWRPFTATMPWELSPGDGEKIVSVQFKRGNLYSPVYAARPFLDTRPPAIFGLGPRIVTGTEAVFSWRTDEPCKGGLELWQGGRWVAVFFDSSHSEGHEAALSGLRPGTRYAVRVFAADRAGNLSGSLPYEFETVYAPDLTPPTGRLLINAGARYTNDIYVTLTIEGNDYDSGLGEMSLSNDGIIWSMPEPYAPNKTWRLQPGDGPKNVFLRLIDRAGNSSPAITARIILDTRPPAIGSLSSRILPDGRLLFTWRTNEPSFGLVQLGIAPNFSEPSEDALRSSEFAQEHTAVMALLGKTRIVYYRVVACDEAGNSAYSGIGSLVIQELDTAGPVGGIAFAGEGTQYTRETRVTLVLWAEDPSGITRMRLRNADGPWGPWEPFAAQRSWNLTAGDGEKTVQVRYEDGAGNESPIYSARIVLDTKPPRIESISSRRVGPDAVEISWRTDEPTLGVVRYGPTGRDYRDHHPEGGAHLQDHRVRITRLNPGRIYYAVVEAVDRAGNRTVSPEFTIDLRPDPPPQQVNYALAEQGAKATAQVRPPQAAKGEPALAIDGRPDTCWMLLSLSAGPLLSAANKPAEWRLDLKKRQRIATIRIILAGRGDFSLEIMERGRWRRLQRVEEKGYPSFLKAEKSGVLTLEFALGTEIDGLRLVWEKVPREGLRLFEVEAWGDASHAP